MKKNYIFFFFFCVAASTAFPQKISFVSKTIEPVKISGKEKSTCDTLWQNAANWSPPTIFSSINGGYVGGHNGYGDKQKVQQILYSGSNGWDIMGTILWFGGKKNDSGNPNSKITVHTYNLNGTGASSAGLVSCPNTKLNTEDLLISDCDTSTGNWNV